MLVKLKHGKSLSLPAGATAVKVVRIGPNYVTLDVETKNPKERQPRRPAGLPQ